MTVRKPDGIGEQYDEIIIDREGAVEVKQHGYVEGECRESLRGLEQHLGVVTHREATGACDGGDEYQPIASM